MDPSKPCPSPASHSSLPQNILSHEHGPRQPPSWKVGGPSEAGGGLGTSSCAGKPRAFPQQMGLSYRRLSSGPSHRDWQHERHQRLPKMFV